MALRLTLQTIDFIDNLISTYKTATKHGRLIVGHGCEQPVERVAAFVTN